MRTVTLNGLATRKLRAVLTAIAIVLGVAMISGTYVLMDTTMHAFDSLFTTAYSQAQAVVIGKSPVSGGHVSAPPVPASVVARIRVLPQVSEVQGFIDDRAEIRNASGAAITGPGSPLAFGVPAHGGVFGALTVVAGHRPSGPGQVALDEQTAKTQHFGIGSRIAIVTRQPMRWFHVVGIVRFGGVQTLGPIQLVVLDLPVAQQLFGKQGYYDEIYVSARKGVSEGQLVRTIAPILPASAEVKTGAAQARSTTNNVNTQFAPVRYVLLAFGAIALFVGSFVIFNTLSITVAQRTRELATLRTLGASRRQILASVVLEALVIGVLASLVGLVAGLGLAKGLESMFASTGMQLPTAGTVFATRTVLVSLLAGIAVTLAASLAPALRATRVAPIAAVREGATLPPGRYARARSSLLAVVAVAGAGALGLGLFASGLTTAVRLLLLAAGAAFLFIGLAFVSRWLIVPLTSAIGRPFETLAGAPGMLARENSCRNPARTAVTAGALTVGLALVAFVATLGAGLRGTINDTVRQQVHADYVISADTATLSPTVAAILQRHGAVTATDIRQGQTSTFGKTEQINGVDPATIARFYRFKWQSGSGAGALTALGMTGSIVSNQFASDHHLQLGDSFTVQTESGTRLHLVVRGIQSTPTFGTVLGAVTINTALFDQSFTQPADSVVLANTGGVSSAAQQRLTSALAGFPDAKIRTVPAYINTAQATVNTLLNLLYVLLALSVIVSLFGIVNTLALSIVERTREIGTLRAIGMTRRQLKRMINIESEITALIGATLGIVVGLVLAALATAALATWSLTFSVPWPTLLVLAIIAFFAGRIAGALPARRASRLDPLQALHYE